MSIYEIDMVAAYAGSVRYGAFDHWVGETVPLRGPNQEIIGEATVMSVDDRDGGVCITVNSTVNSTEAVARLASIIRRRNSMSFSVKEAPVFQPRRDDEVAKWLKAQREEFAEYNDDIPYYILDNLLDDYRLHADTGVPLNSDEPMGG